jgi:hypothetical protein
LYNNIHLFMITRHYRLLSGSLLLAGLLLSIIPGSLHAQTSTSAGEGEEQSTTVGGYGEVHYTDPEGTERGTVDVARFVIFLEHYFSPELSFFSELELEHTKLEGGEGGEVALEQAYLQYNLDPRLNIRAGLLVLPLGIINEYHEPPTFNGVERPHFAHDVIPTTAREIGLGLVGRIPEIEGLQYRAYLTTGLNAEGFSADEGIREGRLEGAEAEMNSLAISGKVEYITGGLRAGGWLYYGGSAFGNTAIGEGLFAAPVFMAGLDGQFNVGDLYLRGELATVSISDAKKINDAYHSAGIDSTSGEIQYRDPIGSGIGGGYVEAAYNVAKLIRPSTSHQLLPFVRFEKFNTQASVPERVTADPANDRTYVIAGLTYKPVYNAAFKIDWTFAKNGTEAKVPGQLALGVGYNF